MRLKNNFRKFKNPKIKSIKVLTRKGPVGLKLYFVYCTLYTSLFKLKRVGKNIKYTQFYLKVVFLIHNFTYSRLPNPQFYGFRFLKLFTALNVFLYLERSRRTSSRLDIISGTFTVLYSISGARHLAYT